MQKKENNYFMAGAHSTDELNRLLQQDDDVTARLPLVPPQWSPSAHSQVIDLACGPGGWLMEMAFTYPELTLLGVDSMNTMLQYARSRNDDLCYSIQFDLTNITRPNLFESLTLQPPYSLIHLRFAGGFLRKQEWQPLLEQCLAALSPGGWIYLGEWGYFQFPPFLERICQATALALWKAQMNDSSTTYDYTFLASVLQQAGYEAIEKTNYQLDYSDKNFVSFKRNMGLAVRNVEPFLLKMNVFSHAEYTIALEGTLDELEYPESYKFMASIDTICAQKPLSC